LLVHSSEVRIPAEPGNRQPGFAPPRGPGYSEKIMVSDASVRFFERQFQQQVRQHDLRLNPFEAAALPLLHGRVLDFGCGLGNLAVAAARQGCTVVALDASHTAIEHLREVATLSGLPIEAAQADLRGYRLQEPFDAVACIGLLMFFDCDTALAALRELQEHVRPGGVAVVNWLEQGTTYLDMFDPRDHCLFPRDELRRRFAGWEILHLAHEDLPAPGGRVKAFATVHARRPALRLAA